MFIIFLTALVSMLGIGLIIPVIAPLFLDPVRGVLPADTPLASRTLIMGLMMSAFSLAQFFGAPFLGTLSDRIGRKPVFRWTLWGMAVSFVLFALGVEFKNLPLLFISRLLDGFMGGGFSVASSAIADLSDERSKPRNFGLIGMAFGLGMVFGPFLGGFLSDPSLLSWFGYATPFWFTAALTLFNVWLVGRYFRETLKTPRDRTFRWMSAVHNLQRAFALREFRAIFTVLFLYVMGFSFFVNFFQVYLIEHFRYTQKELGLQFAYTGLWIIFTQGVLIRPISRLFAARQILKGTLLLLAVAISATLLPTRGWMFLLVLPFTAIGQGLSMPSSTSVVSSLAGRGDQGEILGLSQSVSAAAMIVTPLIGGELAGWSPAYPLMAGSLCVLMSWGVYMVFFRGKGGRGEREILLRQGYGGQAG